MPDASSAYVEQDFKSMRWLWLSVLVVGLDQLTKALVSTNFSLYEFVPLFPSVNLTLLHNTGAAFSLLDDAGGWQRWLFVVLALIISGMIVVWLYGLGGKRPWLACALALVLGGALGNLWDRVQLGYVIDFVDVYYQQWHWPAFNVADSAITLGAIMLVIDAFRGPD
jgi:signal peptidase II